MSDLKSTVRRITSTEAVSSDGIQIDAVNLSRTGKASGIQNIIMIIHLLALRTDAGGESAAWMFHVHLDKRSGQSSFKQVGTTNKMTMKGSNTWLADIVDDAGTLKLKVTGQAGKRIEWTIHCEEILRK